MFMRSGEEGEAHTEEGEDSEEDWASIELSNT